MKWSMFILDTREVSTTDNVILFNTLNKSLAVIDRQLYEKLLSLEPVLFRSFCQENGCEDVLSLLIQEEFIIPADRDEEKAYTTSLKRQIEEHDSLAIHFLPTLDCNFRCPYCYQDGISRNHRMDSESLELICDSVEKYLCENTHIKNVTITLHGGEPTYYWDIVPQAMKRFSEVAATNGGTLYTSIVSNGYLLTPEKADLLANYNWYRFQVTIDGPQAIHNKRRCLPTGEDTFTRIVNNMKYILDNGILRSIDVRINFDETNVTEIPTLIDYSWRVTHLQECKLRVPDIS